MSILSWNCHGLGNPWAIQFLKDLVIQKQPKVVFLCETLSRTKVLERLRVSLGFGGFFSVDVRGKSGGVALLWRDSDDIKVLGYGVNYIDVEVSENDGNRWRLTGLFGEPNRSLRRNTWDQIQTLKDMYALPWCIIGDLNNVTSESAKRGGNPYPNCLVDGFGNMLEECNSVDMDLCGYPYTWEKGRGEPACLQIVKDTWELLSGCSIMEKISYCGDKLLVWGKDYVGNFKDRIQACKTKIRKWKKGRDEASVLNYKNAEARFQEVLIKKEIFWRQRSKQLWLKEGDQNSKYFHAMATSRRRNNSIQRLKNDQGMWIDWDNNLSGLMVDYFSKLFSSSPLEIREVTDAIPNVVSDMQNALLLEPITYDEVRRALFQMHPDKSPGPDGMTPGFFQKYWSVVGGDVVSQVRMFFDTGYFSPLLNETCIVLILKKKQPESMMDLRPISLCNVVYKVISKVLANRMKSVLPCVISETQSAFIQGRFISDNIMISFEIMHYLK
ncbi:uncharacterized protein LOC115696692 [Cannabis sativa]|uniref:uncharacterized protein LOC115696692 n=1 Tax=Cannabis sativa TaxID=3483 RepID=UPI0011DFDE77|nr:uncharacterized protein LOC115696692 [Cannabis sativa]